MATTESILTLVKLLSFSGHKNCVQANSMYVRVHEYSAYSTGCHFPDFVSRTPTILMWRSFNRQKHGPGRKCENWAQIHPEKFDSDLLGIHDAFHGILCNDQYPVLSQHGQSVCLSFLASPFLSFYARRYDERSRGWSELLLFFWHSHFWQDF